MKAILTSIAIGVIIFIIIFLAAYLMGSFYNINMNIGHWSNEGRFVVLIFGFPMGSIVGSTAGIFYYQFQKLP
jgi:hypothetical protein